MMIFILLIHLLHFKTISQTHTHTTHTHVGFYGLRGLSIGVMFLYCTNCMCYCPTPTLHLNLALTETVHFYFPPKNLLCMIYKHFELWGHWKCPHKSPSPCNTYVIPCHYTNLCPHKPHKHAHTHTHIYMCVCLCIYIYIYIYIYIIWNLKKLSNYVLKSAGLLLFI